MIEATADGQVEFPEITLHVLEGSHPALAVEAALGSRGIAYERVVLRIGPTYPQDVEAIYGEGKQTVPGMLLGDEPVHGSMAIFERLDTLLASDLAFFPEPHADEVREAATWGDEVFQQAGRRLFWGSLQFKPHATAQAIGGEPLDPVGTDFAIKLVRGTWKHHGIDCVLVAEALSNLPGCLDRIDDLIGRGILGQNAELPNAADLQIGATVALMATIGDLRPLFEDRPCAKLANLTQPRPGLIPAGAFPEHWMPTAAS
ncbi:MAG: glutathione S-transferase N-terminal domain-containing protein [Solirubrobacterales bacterium]